jgi:hypothetical protein
MHNDVQLLPSREASVARAVICDPKKRAAFEPLYGIDPQAGASIELFYADRALANSFGRGTGWFWWSCQRGSLPDGLPTGPFATSYAAYRNFALDRGVASNLRHGAASALTVRSWNLFGTFPEDCG